MSSPHRRPAPRVSQRDAAGRHDHRPADRAYSSPARSSPRRCSRSRGWVRGSQARSRTRDYPVLQGGILFVALVFVLVNLIVDVSYALPQPADPRELMSVAEIEDQGDPTRVGPERALGRSLVPPAPKPGRDRRVRPRRAVRVHRDLRAAHRTVRPARAGPEPPGGRLLPRAVGATTGSASTSSDATSSRASSTAPGTRSSSASSRSRSA